MRRKEEGTNIEGRKNEHIEKEGTEEDRWNRDKRKEEGEKWESRDRKKEARGKIGPIKKREVKTWGIN